MQRIIRILQNSGIEKEKFMGDDMESVGAISTLAIFDLI